MARNDNFVTYYYIDCDVNKVDKKNEVEDAGQQQFKNYQRFRHRIPWWKSYVETFFRRNWHACYININNHNFF